MEAPSACSRVSGTRHHEEDNNDDANNYTNNNPQLPDDRQTRNDRMFDTILRAHRRVRFDALKRSHNLLSRILANERQRLDDLVRVSSRPPFFIQNPNRYRWEEIDDMAEVSEEQAKAAALRVRGIILLIDECRLQQRLNMTPPARLGPYKPLLLMRNDNRDDVEAEMKELMHITYSRVFEDYY